MATLIYRRDENGEISADRCDTKFLQGKLAQGYVVDPAELEAVNPPADEEPTGNRWHNVSNDEVRELAKNAGVEGHATKRVTKLKAALDAQE